MPDEVYNKPRGTKMFIYGSTMFHIEQLEAEERKRQNKPKSAR